MEISIDTPNNLKELASFLEKMNNQSTSHIGFCGEEQNEIYDTLVHDFSDLDINDSFLVAYEHSEIVGAIGVDVDSEKKYADVLGPFVANNDLQIAQSLWEKMMTNMPDEIKTFSFFFNQENTFVLNFLVENKGIDQGSDVVLKRTRDSQAIHTQDSIKNYSDLYQKSFVNLHNQVFPTTYFDAATILKRLHSFNHLFIVPENERGIKGYVYLEANPKHQESNIEYIAVSEKYRKEGVGKTLLLKAIDQLFSYPEIEEITICVGGENEAAIALYRSVGFVEKYQLLSYKIVRQ
ncbi:GNAT family N-acetyltransferase [Alkalicoccobacillus murimartini]|uniref:Ribosomal protein S18 acetylase RimI-like enzyme n=1 Tax=Alkalicoccobacillus murimartini TaxID=171685 RepID=A0ABT9YFP3_9BACI|nr:N-acetyltransferase [Alkalicoccobacillus murimartini]MDQ0206657.1 ribosomal protein S18 acetylase RimI-like enzyme [Alkalicoccobacillus murimartini]